MKRKVNSKTPIEVMFVKEAKIRVEKMRDTFQEEVSYSATGVKEYVTCPKTGFNLLMEHILQNLDNALFYLDIYPPDKMFEVVTLLDDGDIEAAKSLARSIMEEI